MRNLAVWLLIAVLACALIYVTISKAGGLDIPKTGMSESAVPKTGALDIHCYIRDAGDLEAAVMGGTWLLFRNGALKRESDNPTGEVHWRVSAMEARYEIELLPPSGYEKPEPQSFRWPDDAPLGEFIFITQRIYSTPTAGIPAPSPPAYLQPPSIWPWPIIVPSAEDQVAIADGARQARSLSATGGGPYKPIADMQGNRLWQIARDYQLGAQLGQEYVYNEYTCMEFVQGIVILGQDGIGYGVVSPFGSWQ